MKLQTFASKAKLEEQTELEKVRLLTYYYLKIHGTAEVELSAILALFDELHFTRPNVSRLSQKIVASGNFIRAKRVGWIKLHARSITMLAKTFTELEMESEVIENDGMIIPSSVYSGLPNYVVKLADQINASYENRIFDGCAVLMRRLLEVLLIQSYEKYGCESNIQDSSGNYKMLEGIANDAKTNSLIKLSRNTKKSLEDFRLVGNFAAHKIYYSTRKSDLDKIKLDYRAAIEELLYKSGHLT